MKTDPTTDRINSVLWAFRRLCRNLFNSGPKLTKIEEAIIDALSRKLSEDERAVLQKQLENVGVIQRSPGDRMTILYFDPQITLPVLVGESEGHSFARMVLRGGEKRLTAEIKTHAGRIFSIEFHGSPSRINTDSLELLEVVRFPKHRSVAAALDRLEHERDDA